VKRGRKDEKTFEFHPLITASGSSRATLRPIHARCTTSTTRATSLYACGVKQMQRERRA